MPRLKSPGRTGKTTAGGQKEVVSHAFFRKTNRRRPKVLLPDMHKFALAGNKSGFIRSCLISYLKGSEAKEEEKINFVEIPRTDGLAPIHCALHKNHTDIALYIIKNRKKLGADILMRAGERKWNIFHYLGSITGRQGRTDIFEALGELLLKGNGLGKGNIVRAITALDWQGYNSIMLAVEWKRFDVLKRLMKYLNMDKDNTGIIRDVFSNSVDSIAGNNLFHLCARKGSESTAKFLMDMLKATVGRIALQDQMKQRRTLDNLLPFEVAKRFLHVPVRRMFEAAAVAN